LLDALLVLGVLVYLLELDHGVLYVFVSDLGGVLSLFVGTGVGQLVEYLVERLLFLLLDLKQRENQSGGEFLGLDDLAPLTGVQTSDVLLVLGPREVKSDVFSYFL